MANQDVTIYSLTRNTGVVCTPVAVTQTDLIITPTKSCNKLVLIISTTNGAGCTVNIAAGGFWAKQALTQVTVANGVPQAFVFESARYSKYVVNTAGVVYDYRITVVLGTTATTNYQCLQLP